MLLAKSALTQSLERCIASGLQIANPDDRQRHHGLRKRSQARKLKHSVNMHQNTLAVTTSLFRHLQLFDFPPSFVLDKQKSSRDWCTRIGKSVATSLGHCAKKRIILSKQRASQHWSTQ